MCKPDSVTRKSQRLNSVLIIIGPLGIVNAKYRVTTLFGVSIPKRYQVESLPFENHNDINIWGSIAQTFRFTERPGRTRRPTSASKTCLGRG